MKRLSVFICFLLFCTSCTHVQTTTNAAAPSAVQPVEIKSPVVPQMDKGKKALTEASVDRFSFTLKEADVKDVLRGLSKQTNYNVVIEPDVKGMCTVDLKDVTLVKALDYILEPLDYTFKIEEKTIYVSKPKLETNSGLLALSRAIASSCPAGVPD